MTKLQNQVPSGPRQGCKWVWPDFRNWVLWPKREHRFCVKSQISGLIRFVGSVGPPAGHFPPLYETSTSQVLASRPHSDFIVRISVLISCKAFSTFHTHLCIYLLTVCSPTSVFTRRSVDKPRGFHKLGWGSIYIIIFTNFELKFNIFNCEYTQHVTVYQQCLWPSHQQKSRLLSYYIAVGTSISKYHRASSLFERTVVHIVVCESCYIRH